jgi:hypothetical protein
MTISKHDSGRLVELEIARALALRAEGRAYETPECIKEALAASAVALTHANHSEARIRAAVSRNATDSEARIRLGLIIGGANEAETKEIA